MTEPIYEPISGNVEKVKTMLTGISDEAAVSFPETGQMLRQILGGGKLLRLRLVLHAGNFYNYNEQKILAMATGVELLHISTLVHDDAIDKAKTRRGRPTINSIWGTDKAIVLGDFMFARAAEFVADTESIRAVKLVAGGLGSISMGELRQGFSLYRLDQDFNQYLRRIIDKTASLFSISTESGAILSDAPEESVQILKNYGLNLGIAFQIMDDVLDFIGTEEELGKPVGSDLLQGILTLPSLKILEYYPGDNPVLRLFEGQGDSKQNVAEAIDLINNTSILEECLKVAQDYSRAACKDLDLLPSSPSTESLYALADLMIKRRN
ncbi:MAG: polyprenyl synthetase family protein [Dehalococcoidales bacterium]|nr:polyprenyl synthetase family protein [Dehalococcoidales bacterium]